MSHMNSQRKASGFTLTHLQHVYTNLLRIIVQPSTDDVKIVQRQYSALEFVGLVCINSVTTYIFSKFSLSLIHNHFIIVNFPHN